ncbi:MAG TPA: PSD1 and planctomycete cytochrome C domain-containing protein, partial [Pirellulales bacterium]|nr:PSD1 and planctomycete cytochrome C domain-containing protein [Pirellulales bacterium]
VLPLLKARCVKCHGPVKREGGLNLAAPRSIARGGETGPAVDRKQTLQSLLWQRIEANEMPPKEPLSSEERATVRHWLEAGAPGLPQAVDGSEAADHWAFQHLSPAVPSEIRQAAAARNAIDGFLLSKLEAKGLSFSPEADRPTLIRRVSFDLTGLPPSPDEIAQFAADRSADAYERMVDRYLASPRYGERWGKHWLDAAGYADSNGYFNADSDRPLAYRYRDYVVASLNRDKPFDRFLQEQLAGDELSGYRPGEEAPPEMVELLVATHFLRNSQDGTGESDGSPDEVLADRYAVLEGAEQIWGSALFGLTFQCAHCHDHKFEPVTQREYYQLQAILRPAFNLDHWLKPNERHVLTASAAELADWEARMKGLDAEIAEHRRKFGQWAAEHRPRGEILFEDRFDAPEELTSLWSNTAPGDDAPGGSPAVHVGAGAAPGAVCEAGALRLIESGGPGNRWLSTANSFDWTPDESGGWIQVTFDLVADQLPSGSDPAARIGYYIGLNDFDDNADRKGNILFDGNPAGGADVHLDYPGADSISAAKLGSSPYQPGRNYGVRVTNVGEGKFRLDHLADTAPDEQTVTLAADDLADGGFGFEFCCGRSFIVDNVLIERGKPPLEGDDPSTSFETQLQARRKQLEQAVAAANARRGEKPGKAAWLSDVSPQPPEVFLLVRGAYSQPGEKVEPGVPAVLSDPDNQYAAIVPSSGAATTGRRLALAQWLTRPNSRAAALLARVTVNRIWQHHFGVGLATSADNLGYSGAAPSHRELLDWLAAEFVEQGWSMKSLHRRVLASAAYRQASLSREDAIAVDPGNRLLWRFPLRRLDAESIRDGMLAVAGELDLAPDGPYTPTQRTGEGEVVVDESLPGARRRSLYLQQRRTQVLSLLDVYDAPSIVANCTRRSQSAMPLQALSALNSAFALARAKAFCARLERETADELPPRLERAFLLAVGRPPEAAEREAAERFFAAQRANYGERPDAGRQAWTDFCQMLMAGNAFLYVE